MLAGTMALGTGCGGGEAPAGRAGPSPLLGMDGERLWILLWARGDMNPGCGRFYSDPADPRYVDREGACERWLASALEVLQANGVPGVEAGHLRDPEFWGWYFERAQAIASCSAAELKTADSATGAGRRRRLSCNPYERLTRVEKKTMEQAGIRLR